MLICDNEALLIRIETASAWTYTTPNVTLRAEWDIESVILDVLKELKMTFQFIHVKSHQDDETPLATLTLEARLNVEADRLATEYMQEDHIRRPTVALFPSAKAQFLIQDVSVTRKIPQAIRYAAGSKPIRTYPMERNQWTERTMDEIDWNAHGASHSHHRPQLCHRHLPLGHTLQRRNTKYSPTCPGCREVPEDQNHYLQCTAASHIAWRISLLTKLRTQLRRTTLNSQACIGWLGLLRGYWSTRWQQEYKTVYKDPTEDTRKEKTKRKLQMGRWQNQIIQTIWSALITLWKTRNDERHGWGWDAETKESARREVLHKELEELYERKYEYPLRAQRLLRGSYKIHIQESVTKIADWMYACQGTFALPCSPD